MSAHPPVMHARRTLRRLRHDERGFTLVELMTSMAVFGIFLAAAALVLGSAIRNSSTVEDQAATQAEVRAAVDRMAGEIRQAYSDSTIANSITTWTGTTLTFYTPDRQSPFHLQLVSYRVTSGGVFQRAFVASTNTGTTGPWTWTGGAATLGSYTDLFSKDTNTSLVFSYWQSNGVTAATTLANLAFVRIIITVSPRGSQTRTFTYTAQAAPRT